MKICKECKIEKPLDDFYKHKDMPDGYLNFCKVCKRQQSKDRELKLRENPHWVELEKIRAREKYYRLQYREKHKPSYDSKKQAMLNYTNKYPEKLLAKNAISNFIRKEGIQLHHWSYLEDHYKDVIELSIQNHACAHRYLIYDQERMQYRTLDSILLDNKEAHLEYINSKFNI